MSFVNFTRYNSSAEVDCFNAHCSAIIPIMLNLIMKKIVNSFFEVTVKKLLAYLFVGMADTVPYFFRPRVFKQKLTVDLCYSDRCF